MIPLHVGVDLIEVERIADLLGNYGERFTHRIYTVRELAICNQQPERLATRFAAKEAVSKALGTGIGAVGWKQIEVINNSMGCPELLLSGAAAAQSASMGINQWSISLSHTSKQAIALVVATG